MTIECKDIFNDILRFREKYTNQLIVIKYGGAIAADKAIVKGIGEQAAFLNRAIGAKVIIVHGGGEQVNKAMKEVGLKAEFDSLTGKRVTSEKTLNIFDKTVRELNKNNTQIMQDVSDEVHFQGMAGYDMDVVQATSESDFTGSIASVDQKCLSNLINDNHIPVFYSACRNTRPRNGENRLNVNADDFAAAIGSKMGAIRLVLLSDVEGVLDKKGQLLTGLSTDEIQGLIDDGTVTDGMVPKLNGAKKCAEQMPSGGVVILDGAQKNIILKEILFEQGAGTLIRSPERMTNTITALDI